MYPLLGIFFSAFLLFLNHLRKKRIIRIICNMHTKEKYELLNKLIQPFGYSYIPSRDIFASHADARPQEAAHCTVFKQTAARPGMVFDTLPVYFNHGDKTWLIEFGKGQSGIRTCGRIGVYYADRILDKRERELTPFQSADKESLQKLSFSFYTQKEEIAQISAEHRRLAICKTGCFSMPSDLSMKTSLTFPSFEMAKAFAEGLVSTGYPCDDVCIYLQTVSFTFSESVIIRNPFRRLRNGIVQYRNHFLCRVYCLLTRPFCLSADRMLYLHYYLPFALHIIFRTES